jgi:hypothetical protein
MNRSHPAPSRMSPVRRRRKASVGAHRLPRFRNNHARVPAINCGACGQKIAAAPAGNNARLGCGSSCARRHQMRLLQNEKDRGSFSLGDTSLPTYLYCLNAYVTKAEVMAARNTTAINKDSFVDWLRRNCKASSDFIRQPTTMNTDFQNQGFTDDRNKKIYACRSGSLLPSDWCGRNTRFHSNRGFLHA